MQRRHRLRYPGRRYIRLERILLGLEIAQLFDQRATAAGVRDRPHDRADLPLDPCERRLKL